MRAFKQFFTGAWSLIAGLSVTIRYMFKNRVTVRYPKERVKLTPAYRGRIQLIRFEDTGTHNCVACMQCPQICPSNCIEIVGEKDPETRKKRPTKFELRYELCSLCGLCVDVCPTATLEYSKAYDEVSHDRADFMHDILEPFKE